MSEEKEKEHYPVFDFFKGILIGSLILFGVTPFSFLLIITLGLGNSFWGSIILIVVIQFTIGILVWNRSKRKFMALGIFLSLPIIAFIFFSICGSFFY